MADVQISFHGSVVGLTPLTDTAKTWIDDNCETEGWQWLGSTLYIDTRYAGDVQAGMENDGLEIAQ
jgi:hypothetical protein